MTSLPDHSGRLIYQRADDASLKHDPVRKSREDAKRGGQRTGAGSQLTEVTDRGPASRRTRRQTGNAKPSRGRQPMPDNDMDQFGSEDL